MAETDVILMLSGGRDSFLSACHLLEDPIGYRLKMVTYDNGCSYKSENARQSAERIIAKYGESRVEYLGVYRIASVLRQFFAPYFNMKPEEQLSKYSGMTPSQYHCLICRTTMYIYSIWLAMIHDACYVAEGARKDQQFVIELPGMAQKRYPDLVRSAGLELLLPVYDLNSDWDRDNELMARGYFCKNLEPKCLIGFPVYNSIDQSVIKGVHAYYDHEILPYIQSHNLLTIENARIHTNGCYDEIK